MAELPVMFDNGWANGPQTIKDFYNFMYRDVQSPTGEAGVDALLKLRHAQPDYNGDSINRDWRNVSDQLRQSYKPSIWNRILNAIPPFNRTENTEKRSVIPMATRTSMPEDWMVTTETMNKPANPSILGMGIGMGYIGRYNPFTKAVKSIDSSQTRAHEMGHALSDAVGNKNRYAFSTDYWGKNPEELHSELSAYRSKYGQPIITKEDASQFYDWLIPKMEHDFPWIHDENGADNMYKIIAKPENRSLIENIMRGIVQNKNPNKPEIYA